MDGSTTYTLNVKIHEGQNSLIFRAIRDHDQVPVVIKFLKGEYPSPRAFAQLRREYTTLHDLNLPGVIRVYSLENYGNGLALVMEDGGGVPLSDILHGQPLRLRRALEIALSLARTLAALHQRNIVHKDIKPHNILVNPATEETTLIDFGIAMRIAQETARVGSPEALEGTLLYMSPEQSGRMNRVVDHRTDLYSLGVTFYEMLTGSLPFAGSDAMEVVHSHIARTPVAPHQRAPSVPPVVSNIVMRLLAKGPEDRYQHARGLAADLVTCLQTLDAEGNIPTFELGKRDLPDVLRVPQKLYGREDDIQALMDNFSRVREGRPALLLFSGGAGVGKSVLVHEVHKAIARSGGRFVAGKFDLLQSGAPLSALTRAFEELVRQMLTESSATLGEWRTRLRAALGPNGQLVVDLVPELERIIDRQEAPAQLGPAESQNRFGLVFQNFVRAFCTSSSPLVVFLDDLQWADPGTLAMLRLLLTDPGGRNLLLIGAFRDQEVDAGHPLRATIDYLRGEGVPVDERQLGPLDWASVQRLLSDTLTPYGERSLDNLTALAHDKTHGNPFFLTQFLLTLYQRGLIRLDQEEGQWTWDEQAIRVEPITDNVVEFMSEKLRLLDEGTQVLLAVAACIGHEFDLVTLATISDRTLGQLAFDLWPALQAGLVVPLDSDYRLLPGGDASPEGEHDEVSDLAPMCRFLHDRVQQAALSLGGDQDLAEVHLRIGRTLRARVGREPQGEALFEMVRHFNSGASRMEDPVERIELARANLAAGRAAKTASAHSAASQYLTAGIAMLPASCWDDEFDLTFVLERELAECEFMAGRSEQADTVFELLFTRARNDLTRIDLYRLRMLLRGGQGNFAGALADGRQGLALFGIHLPDSPAELMAAIGASSQAIDEHLKTRTIESLVDLPVMTDEAARAQLRLLTDVFMPAFVANALLGSVIILKQVLLSLTHGNAELSAFGYASYGYALAGPLQRPEDARRFGQLALGVLDRFPQSEVACRVQFAVGFYFGQTQPLQTTLHHYAEAQRLGSGLGEFMWASQGAVYYTLTQLRLGEDLGAVRERALQALPDLRRMRDFMSLAQATLFGHTIEALLHRQWWDAPLGEDSPEEAAWLANIDAFGLVVVRCLHHIVKLMTLVIFEEFERAHALIPQIEAVLGATVGAPYVHEFPFYAALTLAAVYPSAPEAKQEAMLAEIVRHRDAVAKWSGYCPSNELHRLILLDAEIHRLRGDDMKAMDEFDRSIEYARKNMFFHHEALANELCARFHLGRGRGRIARLYLGQARFGYERWGAHAKVRELDAKYPNLIGRSEPLTPIAAPTRSFATSSLSTTGNQGMDLASVIKASQVLTVEISLQPLLEKIVHIMVENAGARRGVLLLDQDGRLCVVAESSADTGPFTLASPLPLKESQSLPASVIHFVAHTNDSVILEDAVHVGPFTTDPDIVARSLRSVLCTPLVHQGKLIGVLYLEHDLTPGVFSEGRFNTLKLIASQAAISIENANLYANMEGLVRKRTDELSRVNQSLIASNAELDAFGRTVAHDLKNPLGAVSGYAEYLLESLDNLDQSEVAKVVDSIRRASNTAASIVDELLLLAGVRKQQVQITPLDMASIVAQVQQRMAYMLVEYRGEITVADEWPAAIGYAPWIEEAWTNYISNGLKYGGRPPRLTLGADARADGMLRFWVRDNGPGIPREAQDRLFAEFTRLDEVRAEGHGLGLSIVRRIIERLGGRVGVESVPGEGSLFYFTLLPPKS
ncbi:MAG: AAA family ATPase [Myxococcales bacterium]|nr:AAA family ATPase [Myxococcales bacterium]